jgi:geranylgeranyl diphosphate synthase, type I
VLFESRGDVTLAECLAMAADKTGALLATSTALGAILVGAPRATVDAMRGFGADLGLAFQLVDDLLGIWGRPEVTGKPVYADLVAGKKSLPVTAALESGEDAGGQLAEWFATHDPRAAVPLPELEYAAGLVEKAGGRRWAQERADELTTKALAALDTVELRPGAKDTLVALARFVVERKR